jgi:hypothetical protein
MPDSNRERRGLGMPRRLAQQVARVAVAAAACAMLVGVQQAQAYSSTIERPWGYAQISPDRKAASACDTAEDNRFVVTQFRTLRAVERGVWFSVTDNNGSRPGCGSDVPKRDRDEREPLIVRFRLCLPLRAAFFHLVIPNCTAWVNV